MFLEGRQGRLRTIIIYTHAVYQGAVFLKAEEAGRGVAGLRLGSERTYLHKAEAEVRQIVVKLAVLVKAGGKAHRVGEFDAEELPLERTAAAAEAHADECARAGDVPGHLECAHGNLVCLFGRE